MKNSVLKNEVLLERIKKLVATERRIGVEILECLYEIERRKAYAELREGSTPYDGLYTYCIKELGFTDSQAYQRIQAMRALKELPELKPLIESGSLSVSSVAKVQTHFRNEKKEGVVHEKAEKLELYRAMENRTSREVDRKLAEAKGEKLKVKLILEMDEELEELWKRAKDLSAHRSGGDEAEILKILTRDWLKRNDPLEKETRKSSQSETGGRAHHDARHEARYEPSSPPATEPQEELNSGPQRAVPLSTRIASRIVPARLRRRIWIRDQGKCVRCGSKHALEMDLGRRSKYAQ